MPPKRQRKGAEALASTDSERESCRPTPSKKEKPDSDDDDKPLYEPRMPVPSIYLDQSHQTEKMKEDRQEQIMYYPLDHKFYEVVPILGGRIPGTALMDIKHTKPSRFVFDTLSLQVRFSLVFE